MIEEKIGTGRRKTAVASVRLRSGNGNIKINEKAFDEYFTLDIQRKRVLMPFQTVGGHDHYDVVVRVKGGGIEAQATAIRLGVARALVKEDENLRQDFKNNGYLTRDSRMKERKKYGHRKARKRSQFSKR